MRMRATTPGLSREATRGARLAFGAGVRLRVLAGYLVAKMREIEDHPYRCDALAGFPAKSIREAMARLQGSPLAAVNGVGVILTDADFSAVVPMKIEGVALVDTDDPRGLMSLAAPFLPALKAADIAPGAPPVALTSQGATAYLGPVYAAATETAVGLAIGKQARDRLVALLDHGADTAAPLLFWRMDREMIAAVAGDDAPARDGSDPVDEALAALQDDLDQYEQMLATARIGDQGIDVTLELDYQRAR
jgi:hypothetical protein